MNIQYSPSQCSFRGWIFISRVQKAVLQIGLSCLWNATQVVRVSFIVVVCFARLKVVWASDPSCRFLSFLLNNYLWEIRSLIWIIALNIPSTYTLHALYHKPRPKGFCASITKYLRFPTVIEVGTVNKTTEGFLRHEEGMVPGGCRYVWWCFLKFGRLNNIVKILLWMMVLSMCTLTLNKSISKSANCPDVANEIQGTAFNRGLLFYTVWILFQSLEQHFYLF